MKIAIMQPYIFPYISYFQLIQAVDTFVFYDDVNFIKKGYINRNSILVNGKPYQFSIPCKAVSQNKKINDLMIDITSNSLMKLKETIDISYRKAPYYSDVMPMFTHFFDSMDTFTSVGDMSMQSVHMVADYLEIKTNFEISSKTYLDTQHLANADRLTAISKKAKADTYINSIGGQALYTKNQFAEEDLTLYFLQSNVIDYLQFDNKFVPWLSIIDVMMFNDKETIHKFLNSYTLV